MTILHKAAASPSDAVTLAGMRDVVADFVRRWLASPGVEVGEKGARVLEDVLKVDCDLLPPPSPPASGHGGIVNGDAGHATQLTSGRVAGHGALWRRIFQDRSIYNLLIDLCSGHDPDTARDEKQLSLAQGRLLGILPRLAELNFSAVSSVPHFAQATPLTNGTGRNGSGAGGRRSLLQFAALDMVDMDDDLMARTVVDFFEAFVSITRVSPDSRGKVEAIRLLIREATAEDDMIKAALLSLPDRTVPEEADDLRRWLREIMPSQSTTVAQR
jgi:hypothetical protein